MTRIELNISEKLTTEIDGKKGLNVYTLPKAKEDWLFYYGIVEGVNFIENRIELPYACNSFLLIYESSSVADKLYFTIDPNKIMGYILVDESFGLEEIKLFNYFYLKADQPNNIRYRAWFWLK